MGDNQISITDTDELLGIIPTLLGYHPTHSVVLLGLNGQPRRIDVIVRGDYPTHATYTGALEHLAELLAGRAESAVAIIYHPHADQLGDEQLRRIFAIPVVAIVRVVDSQPQPLHPDGLAQAVLAGRRVLPTRGDVAQSIHHHPDAAAPADLEARLTPFTDPAARDRFAQFHAEDPAMVADLIELAQHASDTDPRTPNLCTVLALLAYRHHDSTLANAALDRTLHLDPGHRLARLLRRAAQAGIHPDELAAALRPADRD